MRDVVYDFEDPRAEDQLIAVGRHGRWCREVRDHLNAVQVFDPETSGVLLSIPDFVVPLNAIRYQGDLVVSELGTGSVVRADGSDPSVRTILATGLAVPTGLAADGDDLWVADLVFGTVSKIADASGAIAPPTVVAVGLAGPEGLAILPGGDLLVVEAGAGRVSRIDPFSGSVTPVAENLGLGAPPPPLAPPTWLFSGVAVGVRGDVYVTGDVDNVVYKIRNLD